MSNEQNNITMTEEQAQAVNSTASRLVVRAYAGTGKTSMLEEYAKARSKRRLLYIAFNKSVQQEAEERFPENVKSKTSHSLAYAKTVARNIFGTNAPSNLRMSDIRNLLNCSPMQAKITLDTLVGFMSSADPVPSRDHIPAEYASRIKPFELSNAVDSANELWKTIITPDQKSLPVPHDAYLKLFQLQELRFGNFDCIMFDEAQDSSPVMTSIVLNQPGDKVFVGDAHQSIYGFRGAVDALDQIVADQTLRMTASFRFGSGIANVASTLLSRLKGESVPLVGLGKHKTQYHVNPHAAYAFLARTNSALFNNAVATMKSNRKFGFVGGVEGYRFDQILDTYHMFNNNKAGIRDVYIRSFASFGEMKELGEEAEDMELRMLCRVVDQYKAEIPHLIESIKSKAEPKPGKNSVVFSTVHKAKGLEFDQVMLADDFMDFFDEDDKPIGLNDVDAEEVNIAYVAATRAIRCLEMPTDMVRWLNTSTVKNPTELLTAKQAGKQAVTHTPEPELIVHALDEPPIPNETPAENGSISLSCSTQDALGLLESILVNIENAHKNNEPATGRRLSNIFNLVANTLNEAGCAHDVQFLSKKYQLGARSASSPQKEKEALRPDETFSDTPSQREPYGDLPLFKAEPKPVKTRAEHVIPTTLQYEPWIISKGIQKCEEAEAEWWEAYQAGKESDVAVALSNRPCIECGAFIPLARVQASANVKRCIECQSELEKTNDGRTRSAADITGSREDHIKMRFRGGS